VLPKSVSLLLLTIYKKKAGGKKRLGKAAIFISQGAGTALGRPMRPLRVCGGRRCVYHLEPPRASTSRCGHRPCRASRHPAHLRTAPPCCPPALAIQTWSSGAIRGAAHGGSVYGGLCGRACGERGGSRCRKGGGGRFLFFFFFFCPYSVSHPLFAPFVSAEAVTAAAAAAGPAPSRRRLSSQQGALRGAVAPAEARRVRCGPF